VTERENYLKGERATIYARLYSASFEPVTEPVVRGFYAAGKDEHEVTMRAVPGQPGKYRGDFIASAPGAYKFFVESDRTTQLNFTVTEPKFELGDTAMNEALLRQMAETSGGAFFREDDLERLPESIRKRGEKVQSPLEIELWSTPLYFALMLSVV